MDRQEKDARLDALRAGAKPGSELDAGDVKAAWEALCQAWPHMTSRPGAGADELLQIRQALGYEPPAALVELLSLSNGAEGAFGTEDLLSAAQVVSNWTVWEEIFDGFDPDDLYGAVEAADDRTVAMYTCPYWVPFAVDGGGNHVAIDLAPGPAGRIGQIILFGPDETEIRCIGTDLADFLWQQVNDAHAREGGYESVDEDAGLSGGLPAGTATEPAPTSEPTRRSWKRRFRK